MDGLSKQLKIPRVVRHNLMPPPPYCRQADKTWCDISSRQGLAQPRLEVSDAGELLQLCEKLNDGSTCALEARINKYLLKQSESETVFFISLTQNTEEAVVQTVSWNILETPLRSHLSSALFSTLQRPETYLGGDLGTVDAEIQQLMERVVNKKHFNVVIVPVFKYKSAKKAAAKKMTKIPQVPYLLCLINPVKDRGYITKFVPETFRFALPILINTLVGEEEARLKEQCLLLLAVARKLFSSLHDLHDLFRDIMLEARKLTNAERCSLFLLDSNNAQLVAKVFDGVVLDADKEVRIPKYQGVAGHVLKTGKLLNIKNAYEHPLFYKGMDDRTGFKTRNILCFPIRDENGIVGVAQLCNKKDGSFDVFDEEAALAFSIYCGLSIMHSMMYKKIADAQARSKLSNELMTYHMKVAESDVKGVLFCQKKHHHPSMEKFTFSPRFLPMSETVCYILAWYRKMEFVTMFRIHEETLVRFLIHIERGYRDFKDAPYHNWMHAFSVAHFIYACLQTLDLIGKHYITALEGLALLTSAVCHDLDHRGTTNSFQLASESVLASLYSSEGSVMERHHLAQTLCTLNIEGCNFLDSLGTDDYISCLDLLRDMILATDLALHLKFLARQYHMAQVGYDKHNKEDRYFFVSFLMTVADLSDQVKDWANTRLITQQIYAEFFKQGDLEKAMSKEPVAMMDREQANIPKLQIEFLNNICLPAYTILSMMFPEARVFVDNINRSIKMWEASKSIFEKYKREGLTAMEILTHRNFTEDIQAILRVDEETESD